MKKEWILIPVTCFSLIFCGWAEAQSSARMRGSAKSPRIDVGQRTMSARGPAATSRSSSAIRQAPSIPGNSRGPLGQHRGRVPNPGGFSPGGVQFSDNPLGGLLGPYLFNEYGYGGRFDPFEGEKAHAKAYRDAAIANAIVNVVGILATANQPQIQQVCPTTTVVTAPPAPRGHVERQRILVQEGRTEEYQVWIPEYVIPATGEVVVGHHETRRRDVPPVYEEREVWVPAP
jgi:hypothetical protein